MRCPTFPLAVDASVMGTHHVASEVSMDNWSANVNTTRRAAIVKNANYFISIDRGHAAHSRMQTSVKVSKQAQRKTDEYSQSIIDNNQFRYEG